MMTTVKPSRTCSSALRLERMDGESERFQVCDLSTTLSKQPWVIHRASFCLQSIKTVAHTAWRCSGSTNAELLSNLKAAGLIKSDRVYAAMQGASTATSLS